ncbi:hypothetical protein [Nocardiopsis ansamitocini]|uniref:Uncharacterized protein n=1 Tax=Nocardiopsis ansamitocini TaxID=1670832 RepID=A0A9W6P7I4_9ACTN|nr:hypothetical protein [Nocardiopsis ansamitocini]GLU48940.1 hypothetical protein Nans01_32910 [Nocardiopsis ansamitocini]
MNDRQGHFGDAPDIDGAGLHRSHKGRASSWAMVLVMVVGFITAGVGLTQGPSWLVVGIGVVVFAFGGLVALAIGIFKDTGVVQEKRPPRSARKRGGSEGNPP